MAAESELTVACLQLQPQFGAPEENRRRIEVQIREAAKLGAKLVVLPELCVSGYVFHSRQEAFSLSEEIPAGQSVRQWIELAAELDVYIVAGICEREGDDLFNSAVLVGPRGFIGTYRKNHLWGEEKLYFEPGNLGFPVFSTPFGRIGILICYDQWFPEAYRSCALAGADIVCVPTNWVPIPGQDPTREAMANIVAMASAHSNSMYIACADRVGIEREQPFIGQSLIISHTGWPISGPASPDKEQIITARINVSDARRKRRWNDFNDILRDRRPTIYQEV